MKTPTNELKARDKGLKCQTGENLRLQDELKKATKERETAIGLELEKYLQSELHQKELNEYAEDSFGADFALCETRAQKLYPALDLEGVEEDEEDTQTEAAAGDAEEDDEAEVGGDRTPTKAPELETGGYGSDVEVLG